MSDSPNGTVVDEASAPARSATYGRNFSYFSHRIFVTYFPEELHEYLYRLFTLEPDAGSPTGVSQKEADNDKLNIELVRWVLLHRSQLNPLALSRLIEAWRGPNNELRIPMRGGIRSDYQYRVDITIQFALELQLADAREHWLVQTRPRLQLALLDAAYYVTRQWMEFNQPEEGDAAATDEVEPPAVLDLSSDAAFRKYLLHRMNLLEDADQPPSKQKPAQGFVPAGVAALPSDEAQEDAETPSTGDEPAPLNEREFRWLFSVVTGIVNTLASSATRAELQRRWQEVEAHRKSPVPAADSSLFDALLVGKDASVLIAKEDGSRRYQWRPRPGADLASKTPREIGLATVHTRTRLVFIADMLRTAMAPTGQLAPSAHPLQLLSDRYRVLPTTPAWERVETALKDLRAAEDEGLGTPDALALDSHVIKQYHALLASEETASTVIHALIIGAALAGMKLRPVAPGIGARPEPHRADRPDGVAWEAGLQVLCDGLLLDAVTLPVARARLVQAYDQLRKLIPLPAYPATDAEAGRWPTRGALEETIAAAFAAGKTVRLGQLSLAELADAAWAALQARMAALAKQADPVALVAGAAEMVCAMHGIGPAAHLPLRLDQVGYRRWTSLLVAMLGPLSRSKSQPSEMPVTMIAHIAERLGIRSLSTAAQGAWIDGIDMHATQHAALREYVDQHQVWTNPLRTPTRGPGRLALVLGAADSTAEPVSITDTWPQPPQGGVVMVTNAAGVTALMSAGLARWTQDMEQPLTAAWEPGMEGKADELALRMTLASLAGSKPLVELWLYRSATVGGRTPRRIDPASAEELWLDPSAPR